MLQLTTVGAPGGPFLQWLAPSAVTFTVVNVAGGPPAADNPEGSIASARSTATNDTSSRLIPNPTLSISMPRVPPSDEDLRLRSALANETYAECRAASRKENAVCDRSRSAMSDAC